MNSCLTVIISPLLLLTGCVTSPNSIWNESQIEGSWYVPKENEDEIYDLTFDFDSNYSLFLGPYGNFGKYELATDSLIVESVSDAKFVFQIEEITDSKLVLKYISGGETNPSFEDYFESNNRLIFKKITKKNDLIVNRITFSSSVCFGTCPSQAIEIDSVGSINYIGGAYSEFEGAGFGHLPEEILKSIFRSVNSLDISEIKEYYESPWTDDASYYLKLELQNKNQPIELESYGFGETPSELALLLFKLMKITQVVSLKHTSLDSLNLHDKNLSEKVFFEEF